MSVKAAGLALHFVLELAALAALAYWGVGAAQGWPMRLLLGVGLPLLAAVGWGVLRTPNDPGRAIVPVPGPVRLLLEWALFASAVVCLFAAGQPTWAMVFGLAAVIDYALMADRVRWLLHQRQPK